MSSVATLDTVMRLDSAAFRQGMVQAANQANAALGSIQKQAVQTASTIQQLKLAAETVGSFYLVKEGISSLIDAQKQLQSIDYTLQAATGSSDKAQEALGFVRNEAQRLGLVLPDAAQGFANLSASATAAGVSLNDQMKLFDAYARASTTLHLSADQSSRALLALEQMFAKGKIQAQELRLQLGQAIPGAAQRFQNAVMDMTKGTNLAGKSFDQLLEAGDLTTAKFFPALVTALQGAGSGAEKAATGLNAQLNRVQTAWFNLKTEVSGGLFNDVATAGAGLLAQHLDHIAGTLSVIGGLGLARVTGAALQSGANAATNYSQQNITGPQMAAAAERDYAAAQAARAAETALAAEQAALLNVVTADSAKAALADAQQQAFEAAAIRDAAAAELQRVQTTVALNEALGVKVKLQAGAVTLAEQEAVATEALNVAEAQLVKSRQSAIAAAAAVARAESQAAGLRTATITATEAATAAEAALAVAQERVAATGLASVFANAAKSFGSFALALVGGPWGAAVAGIGAVAYAIYENNQASVAYRAETDKQAQSLQALQASLKATADSYAQLDSKTNLTQALGISDDGMKSLSDAKDRLAALSDEANHLQALLAASAGGIGNSIADADTQRKLEDVTARMDALRTSIAGAQPAADELARHLNAYLAPAVDGLKNAVKAFQDGGGWSAVFGALASKSDMDANLKTINDAQAKIQTLGAQIQSQSASLAKKIATEGKGHVAQLQYDLDQQIAAINTSYGAGSADANKLIADAKKAAAPGLASAATADAYAASKKKASAVNAQAQAYANLKASQEAQLQALQSQLATTDKTSSEQRTLNEMLAGGDSAFRKLSESEKAEVIAKQRQLVGLRAQATALEQARRSAEDYAAVTADLANIASQRKAENDDMLAGIGIGSQQFADLQKLTAMRREYDNQVKSAGDKLSKGQDHGGIAQKDYDADVKAYKASLDQGTAAAKAAFAKRDIFQSDWDRGFRQGIDDFMTEQQNNAARAASMVSDLTSGFSGAFTQFVSGSESAKKAFGGFIDDMYKRALAFVADKSIQAIFDAFGASTKTTPGATSNGWSSILGNLGNSFGFGSSGARAAGGSVNAGGSYRINENGPEVLTIGTKQFLMMGDRAGTVTPNSQISRSVAGSTTNITNINVQPTSTRRTADQIAAANARKMNTATSRNR